jgi:putative DNA primase/helicase
MSFAVNPTTGEAFCHSQCGRGWDIIALERELAGLAFMEARAAVFAIVGRCEPNGQRRMVATYDYTDESGRLLFQVVRYEPKDFRQRRPGDGCWIWNMKGVSPVLYRLSEILRRDSETVFVCEGEKDVHTLEAWGLPATCNPMGAGKWRPEYSESLRGLSVVIPADNDAAGRSHAVAVAASLLGVTRCIRILELPGLLPKGDVTDWKEAGGTLELFREVTEAATPLNEAALARLRARWGLSTKGESSRVEVQVQAQDEWPVPDRIQSDLPSVEPLSEKLIPASFRPLVRDIAERLQVPMDYPAVVIVLCLAGVVNRRAIIQPKVNDTGWLVVPNLWGGIIAPPGFMKSPVIQAATRPLNQMQDEWRRDHERDLNEFKRVVEEGELRKALWKEEFKRRTKKGAAAPDRPAEIPEEPILRRLIVNDATFEALHQTMSENPAGIFVVRDELTGWWSLLDRAGREGERAFCLQAWNGDTGHTIDRIGRGTIHVPACCMSMVGGIQPGRLRSYLVDALRDGPSNDGLIQRFQLLVWPETIPDFTYVDRAPNAASEEMASRVFRSLVELDADNPVRFRFAPDAQDLFIEWLEGLEARIRGDELHPALISHLSKYRSLMPSLALLFELADRAGFVGFEGSSLAICENFVGLDHAQQAAAWCDDYLESHANRVYSCLITPQLNAARELSDHIRRKHIINKDLSSDWFTARDVYLKGWHGLDTPEAVKAAAAVLAEAGWLRELSVVSGANGGRPSSRYVVNPKVWQ